MDDRTADPPGAALRQVLRWRPDATSTLPDRVAEERPVALGYNGENYAVMMATPHDLDDFALGFSLSEGLIDTPAQLTSVQPRELLEGIALDLTVHAEAPVLAMDAPGRRLAGRSGCGLCGTRDLERAVRPPRAVTADPRIAHSAIQRALAAIVDAQPVNRATGAVHAAAWMRASGDLHLLREDVGRHNALDKLVGAMHRAGLDHRDGFALITSRASYEMVTKAANAGIPVLVAISAPTALALELARSAGVTLVGFARPGSHNVYSHDRRLIDAAAAP